jgi:hypothetical protein
MRQRLQPPRLLENDNASQGVSPASGVVKLPTGSGVENQTREISPSGLYDRDGHPVRLVVVTRTRHGVVRRAAPFAVFGGRPVRYYEFISDARWRGIPWVHVAHGRNPETGRLAVAKGMLAVGQFAVGGIAIGQIAVGFVTVAQIGIGAVAALGQLVAGGWAIGQLAIGLKGAIGMLAVASQAVGMATAGDVCLGGMSACTHRWTVERRDPVAVRAFQNTFFRPFRVNNRSGASTGFGAVRPTRL